MKPAWLVLATLTLAPILAGCITPPTDTETANIDPAATQNTPTWAKDLPDTLTGVKHIAQVDEGTPSGSGIWTHGNYAYLSGLNTGFRVIDLTDITTPVTVGVIENEFFSRDVDFYTTPDGRLIATAAGERGGMHFIDVTDPTTPNVIATLELDGSTHNLAVLPGTALIYNAASDGKGGKIEIIDGTNPNNPTKIAEFGDHGCHDITFYQGEDRQRLYCAGIERTEIWDNTNPLEPTFISSFTNPFISATGALLDQGGALTPGLHHLAMTNEAGTILIVGDEYTGGLGPGCGANTAGKSTPLGALWFYDISGDNEKAPKELGSYAPFVPAEEYATSTTTGNPFGALFGLSCTAHFGNLLPGREALAMGWYRAGVVLVDFSNPAAPAEIAQWNNGGNVWDVKYHHGYLLTGDMNRGLDILEII